MFIYDNFIHADCHAGNLLVQKKKRKKQQTPYYKQIYNSLENKIYYYINKCYFSVCKWYIECKIILKYLIYYNRLEEWQSAAKEALNGVCGDDDTIEQRTV